MRIVVLVSGTGSNLQAVIDAVKSGELDVEIAAVGADRPDTYGVERSDEAGIETFVVNFNSFETRAEWDAALRDKVNESPCHGHCTATPIALKSGVGDACRNSLARASKVSLVMYMG